MRRVSDASYFLVAEVTSCSDGLCSYQDWNVTAGQTYEYYVAAVNAASGTETSTATTVEVFVPTFTPSSESCKTTAADPEPTVKVKGRLTAGPPACSTPYDCGPLGVTTKVED